VGFPEARGAFWRVLGGSVYVTVAFAKKTAKNPEVGAKRGRVAMFEISVFRRKVGCTPKCPKSTFLNIC
jgi:phage-related protein